MRVLGILRHALGGLLLLAGLSSCIRDDVGGGNVQPGDRLPEFRLSMDDGSLLRSDDLLGSPSLLIFFNTTCPDCQRTLPVVQQVYEQYGTQLRFVAVSRAQPASDVRVWWEANGITLPFSAQEDRKVYDLFASSVIPRIYVSDRDAVVRFAFDDSPCPGYADLENAVREVVANL